ncbi:hypothetical protein AB1Y20_002932 [Prymnesium parvum]|uniref:Uncharacterized protein n=1 Tax=Prymnesium parvum TaxID=97485 RepID=A0AB34JAC3_PRYPA
MPSFQDSSGEAYQVMGTAAHAYNLLSSPTLSINAEFTVVPDAFQTPEVSSTLLGSLGVALCGGGGSSALLLELDVATGRVHSPTDADEPALARAAARGFSFELQRYVCRVEAMRCEWEAPCAAPPCAAGVESGLSRARLHLRDPSPLGAPLTFVRNALVRADATVDCRDFRTWPAAAAACDALRRGEAPEARREEWALLLTMPQTRPRHRFPFWELQLPPPRGNATARREAQRLVHGLLGQRAILPPSTRAVRASNRAMSRQLARGFVEAYFGEEGAARPREEAASPAAGLTSLDRMKANTLNPQGQGAIEGVHEHYRLPSLHSHDFRYSRFNCSPGSAEDERRRFAPPYEAYLKQTDDEPSA